MDSTDTITDIYIDVAVALPVSEAYTYAVPAALSSKIVPGKRVLVPFGKRRLTGFIIERRKQKPLQVIKQIIDILDDNPLFPQSMMAYFKWISDYYVYPLGQVIECALPSGLTYKDISVVCITDQGEKALSEKPLPELEHQVLALLRKRPCRLKEFNTLLNGKVSQAFLEKLIQQNLVTMEKTFSGNYVKPKLERFVSLLDINLPEEIRSNVKREVLEVLKTHGDLSATELKTRVPTATHVLKSLEKTGHVKISQRKMYRDPFGDPIPKDQPPVLTPEQNKAIVEILFKLGNGYGAFLLSGVTGSGKTEVYMHLASETLNRGLHVLVMVPEIALISQVERRFRARFGEQVGILHSGLSKGEKFDQWMRILENKVPIVIGTRSAVFAPLENIGLIVVDEEHDTSYKQDSGLMYNGRDLAVIRASFEKCIVVLGSATPSIQSYYNVNIGKYKQVSLTQRIEKRPLSQIKTIDLREHKGLKGIRRYITPPLIQAMQEVLSRKEQVLLFINRRGYANLSVCGACGRTLKCRNCDITLTLHQNINTHCCHYCGFSQAQIPSCPICGSSYIQHLGMGTEKIEIAVSKLFPDARIARMDRDTTRKKGSLLKILKDLKQNAIDILIGTQMVAKGHDFPNITLVGIICADLSLNFPDFRSGARTFQLLAQVAGRAGRGNVPGRVILQTYNPGHFSISSAQTQDFRVFYNQDIGFRKALKYPPFTRLVMFKISGKSSQSTKLHAASLGKAIADLLANKSFSQAITVLGPVESAIPKIANQYRWQVILKGRNAKSLHNFITHLLASKKSLFNHPKVKVAIDVDPIFMM